MSKLLLLILTSCIIFVSCTIWEKPSLNVTPGIDEKASIDIPAPSDSEIVIPPLPEATVTSIPATLTPQEERVFSDTDSDMSPSPLSPVVSPINDSQTNTGNSSFGGN